MIAPFRVESLNNKLKDMWIQWSPDFLNPRFPKPHNISNQTMLPLNMLHSSFIISSPISVSNPRFLWNFSTGMDYLIFLQTWSGGLSCVLSFPVLPAIVVDRSKTFSFPGCSLVRIASSTTLDSLSLVHGFTHDKSAPYLFSTPQKRSQQKKFLSTFWRNSSR